MITIPGGGQITRTTQTAEWVVTTLNRGNAFKSGRQWAAALMKSFLAEELRPTADG